MPPARRIPGQTRPQAQARRRPTALHPDDCDAADQAAADAAASPPLPAIPCLLPAGSPAPASPKPMMRPRGVRPPGIGIRMMKDIQCALRGGDLNREGVAALGIRHRDHDAIVDPTPEQPDVDPIVRTVIQLTEPRQTLRTTLHLKPSSESGDGHFPTSPTKAAAVSPLAKETREPAKSHRPTRREALPPRRNRVPWPTDAARKSTAPETWRLEYCLGSSPPLPACSAPPVGLDGPATAPLRAG